MDCKVCLCEAKGKPVPYMLRTAEISLDEVELKLKGLDFRAERTLAGVDLFFQRREDWERAKEELGDFVYSTGESMEEVVGRLLRDKGLTLSTAESCSAGLLSARIVNVPGSSDYFMGGVVVYSNELKRELLGVKEETLSRFGAVSEETCREMLLGLRERFGTDCGVAITGIAGPGGSGNKPEGLTYIGVFCKDTEVVQVRVFGMGRNPNRFLSSQVALNTLRKLVKEER